MHKWKAACAALLAVAQLAAIPAQAEDEPIVLERSSEWLLDYDKDSCVLVGLFGSEEQSVMLEMRQFEPGDAFQLAVSARGYRPTGRAPELAFLPDPDRMPSSNAMMIELPDGYAGFTNIFILKPVAQVNAESEYARWETPVWPEEERNLREREITGLAVTEAFREDFVLHTGNLHPAMDAMRTCMDELITHWDIDVEAHKTLQRQAHPIDLGEVADEMAPRYPDNMIAQGEQAFLRVRLAVSPEGRATACFHQIEYNNEEFEKSSCEVLMEHARFEPALDSSGTPIASYYVMSVIFKMVTHR